MSADHKAPTEQVPKLRLTDEGLETPEHLVGATGTINVDKPDISIEFFYSGNGLAEYDELSVFPTTGRDNLNGVPSGYIKIQGRLYEIVDVRGLDECHECGSDKVDATGDPPRCYGCDTYLEGIKT